MNGWAVLATYDDRYFVVDEPCFVGRAADGTVNNPTRPNTLPLHASKMWRRSIFARSLGLARGPQARENDLAHAATIKLCAPAAMFFFSPVATTDAGTVGATPAG